MQYQLLILIWMNLVEGWSSPVRAWGRAHRSGYARRCCRATHSRGPFGCTVALHWRGTSDQTRASRVCRKGLLRRTGLLQLLRKDKHAHTALYNDQDAPPGGTLCQPTTTFEALRQQNPWNLWWEEEQSCGSNILLKAEVMMKGLLPTYPPQPCLHSLHPLPGWRKNGRVNKHHVKKRAKGFNHRPHPQIDLFKMSLISTINLLFTVLILSHFMACLSDLYNH